MLREVQEEQEPRETQVPRETLELEVPQDQWDSQVQGELRATKDSVGSLERGVTKATEETTERRETVAPWVIEGLLEHLDLLVSKDQRDPRDSKDPVVRQELWDPQVTRESRASKDSLDTREHLGKRATKEQLEWLAVQAQRVTEVTPALQENVEKLD